AGRDVGLVSRALAGVAYRLNPDGDVVRRIRADAGAGFLAYASGSLWDGNHDAGRGSRYDASTGQHLADLTSSHPIDTISAGGHYLLVDTGPGRALGGIISGLGPNTAVFAAHPGELFGADSALRVDLGADQIEYATCAKLLNYPDLSGRRSTRLRPEISYAM